MCVGVCIRSKVNAARERERDSLYKGTTCHVLATVRKHKNVSQCVLYHYIFVLYRSLTSRLKQAPRPFRRSRSLHLSARESPLIARASLSLSLSLSISLLCVLQRDRFSDDTTKEMHIGIYTSIYFCSTIVQSIKSMTQKQCFDLFWLGRVPSFKEHTTALSC